MNLYRKLFGRKPARGGKPAFPGPGSSPRPSGAPEDAAAPPETIRVFDAYGRELHITRQQWRDHVLLDNLEAARNDPEQLASLILQAVNDGFSADLERHAERLARIDPSPERGTIVLAIVLRLNDRPGDAARVLRRHIARHGESGVLLTNLAQAVAAQGDDAGAREILRRGLGIDPNQETAVGWWRAEAAERHGAAAGIEALQELASLPGSWRARLWLAREALGAGDLPDARRHYDDAFEVSGRPVPEDMLVQVSGDLGNAGHLPEILERVGPHLDPATHGIQLGNNILKALVDLGRIEPARELLQRLYARKRPDWAQALEFWDAEIARANVESTVVSADAKFTVAYLVIEGPVWLPAQSPARELVSAHTDDVVRVAFLGSTAEKGGTEAGGDRIRLELADGPGRLSRALPLFLAEQAEFGLRVKPQTLVPWLQGGESGFVLSGKPWKNDAVARHVRDQADPCDYAVVTHVLAGDEPWRVEARLVRTIDGACLGSTSVAFPSGQPEAGLPTLAANVAALLAEHAAVAPAAPPDLYEVPQGPGFGSYLVKLEQLLATRCAHLEGARGRHLHGEREIIESSVHLCLENPRNLATRFLLLQTCTTMKRVNPSAVADCREKVERLHREHPLPEPARGIAERMLRSVFAG